MSTLFIMRISPEPSNTTPGKMDVDWGAISNDPSAPAINGALYSVEWSINAEKLNLLVADDAIAVATSLGADIKKTTFMVRASN